MSLPEGIPIPDLCQMDLVSWTFGNQEYDQNSKIYVAPDHPSRSITANGARCMVRKLVAGFKAMGLQPGDCVCLHAFNDVSFFAVWSEATLY